MEGKKTATGEGKDCDCWREKDRHWWRKRLRLLEGMKIATGGGNDCDCWRGMTATGGGNDCDCWNERTPLREGLTAMHISKIIKTTVTLCSALVLLVASPSTGTGLQKPSAKPAANNIRFVRAYIVDDRLSALRQQPDLKARLIQRMHVGRPVYVYGAKNASDQTPFYRVALSRRTRGWVHQAAVATPGRAEDDERILQLAEKTKDSVERIALCKVLIDHFQRSPLVPRALLVMGEESDRAAKVLSKRAQKRLGGLKREKQHAALRDFYLNDSSLDRFSKLGVKFDFNESTREFAYDREAFKRVISRFPRSAEAERARQLLSPEAQSVSGGN